MEVNFRGILYPFKWSYWCGNSKLKDRGMNGIRNAARRVSINSDAIEQEPIDKELGIQLHNVSKVYSNTNAKSSSSI